MSTNWQFIIDSRLGTYKDLKSHLNSHVASLSPYHFQSLVSCALFQLQTRLGQKRNSQVEVIAPQLNKFVVVSYVKSKELHYYDIPDCQTIQNRESKPRVVASCDPGRPAWLCWQHSAWWTTRKEKPARPGATILAILWRAAAKNLWAVSVQTIPTTIGRSGPGPTVPARSVNRQPEGPRNNHMLKLKT